MESKKQLGENRKRRTRKRQVDSKSPKELEPGEEEKDSSASTATAEMPSVSSSEREEPGVPTETSLARSQQNAPQSSSAHSDTGVGISDEKAPAVPAPKTPADSIKRSEPPVVRDGTDEYIIQSCFDKTTRTFVATALEFPVLKASGVTRQEAINELKELIKDHLDIAKRRGEPVPEALNNRRYPDRLDIPLSQTLYRKLDILSRQERVGFEQLVAELLSSSLERRADSGRERRPQQPAHHGSPNQRSHSHHHGRRQMGGRGYHDTMQNRENFLEYVRNLEKSGGGGWRKK
ncbi:MAG: hypothetical protein HY537_13900 [Deltaproteobacteria bacterium]|nr:hypothetical protein [Deltaproteobacteria bacterium]